MCNKTANVFTMVIEPVKQCNLCCRHCYSDINNGGVMDTSILSATLEKMVRYADEMGFSDVHIIWHGGEPLLAGIDFFKMAIRLLSPITKRLTCSHFLQTNALLLTDEYCYFFKDHNFNIGISLDGPPDIHNALRVFPDGEGSYSQVMEKIQQLEKFELAFGVCSVASRLSFGQEHRIYAFFRELGYSFHVIPIIPAWADCSESNNYLLNEGEYGEILCRYFDIWSQTETQRITVSPLNLYLKAILENKPFVCQHKSSCVGTHLGIRPNGDAVLCSRFEDHIIGNICCSQISEIYSGHLARQLENRPELLGKCRLCKNWSICHGGCPSNSRAFGKSVLEKDPLCKDYMMVFNHFRKRLDALKEKNSMGLTI